jgi:signal transduction histidine kinase/PAS domain-containing protein
MARVCWLRRSLVEEIGPKCELRVKPALQVFATYNEALIQMEKRLVKLALSDAEIKLRPLQEPELRAIVRAMMTISNFGVLFTGLDHVPMACNPIFGRIFMVDPDAVPAMAVEELRGYVYPRLTDTSAWLKNLDDVYARPENTYTDELELREPFTWVRRHSTPLLGTGGSIIGRLWTFEDITEEKVRARRREVVQRLSVFHDRDPRVVCEEVIQAVANLYESPTILSIQEGDRMVFRAIARPPVGAEGVRENQVKESYCQLVLEQGAPVIVQDGRKHPKVCNVLPIKLGLVRYLGVPLRDSKGRVIGTLCILDSKSDELLGQEDAEFMAVMGSRISVELERERLFDLRTRDQRLALERQAAELEGTQNVLRAMNRGVALAESAKDEAELLAKQEGLLKGILGFKTALLHCGSPCEGGPYCRSWILEDDTFSLEFCGPSSRFSEVYLGAHVSAIADQIALTLAGFRLQRELRDAHEHLRAAQGRLVQAEKLGVVGALAATVAHDIRNIMASIVLEADSSGDPTEALARVRRQVERFSVLSHRLLSYVKPKFMAREPADLNAVIRRAVELLDPQIRASKIRLVVDLQEGLPIVEADPHQVEHLFVNLIVNALHAVSRTAGALTISSGLEADGLKFSLKDNGRGMSSEMIDRIFDPFYSSRPDGFGLGLFSCKRIAEEHGWRLQVLSKENSGSEFTISVPIRSKP